VRYKSSRLCKPRYLQLESSTVLASVGMTKFLQSRLGMRSKITFQLPIASTKKIQRETAVASGYANTSVAQPADEDLSGAAIDEFTSLATATAVDRGIVATLTEANSRLTKQLEDSSQNLKEIKALL
jgi:hypothetical protein